MSKYYSTLRPIGIGCYPNNHDVLEIVNFNERVFVEQINHAAWGYIVFADELSEKEADSYDLISAECKTWFGVLVTIPNDGETTAKMYKAVTSAIKPEEEEKQLKHKILFTMWFDTKEAAEEFINEI